MRKILEFFKNDHIQGSTVSGLSIIALALYFKKVAHIEIPYLENAIPGFIFTIYEAVREKYKGSAWAQVWIWNLLMLAATAAIDLKHHIWPS
ncbi:MAG: hypothetical protein ABIE70_03420 [bacterium]